MVKKETIGKIQLWIGIILLLISIIGGILTYINYNNLLNEYSLAAFNKLETENQLTWSIQGFSINATFIMAYATVSINSFLLSLLFITQGIINLKK